MKKIILYAILMWFFTLAIYSQKPPVKFGKVEVADLEMTSYPLDTSAPAAVLCDYGVFDPNSFQFKRVLRVKIFKKEGLYWADKIFPGSDKTAIRGITFNLENGEIVETKLKNESIFRERVHDDYYRLRVAMPNVKVGSIYDIEFFFPGIPSSWYFQQDIPVKWSELIMNKSPYVDFRKNFYGYERLAVNTDWQWIGKDMPAFKEEAYTNSVENYITKFEFDILSVHFPGYYKAFTTSWEAVTDLLGNNPYFGEAVQGNLFLNSIAKQIEEKYTSDIEKLNAAFEFVKQVKWNEYESLYTTSPNLSEAYNDKIGNSADINLMLVSLLKKLGIVSFPVIMSTRENGFLGFYPSLEKLNYVIAYAKIGDKIYTMDATEEFIPYNFLPERALNNQGRLVMDNNPAIIDLTPTVKGNEKVICNLSFTDDLNLKGTAEYSHFDYAALDFRTNYHKFSSETEFIEERENDFPGLIINNLAIENLDSLMLPVKDKYEIEIKNVVNIINDKVYLNPMLIHQLKENPFKPETRKYPIDYGYLLDKTYSITYAIPNGYQVSELPKQATVKLPENAASFMYSATVLNNTIIITYRFNVNKIVFQPFEYLNLKEFYNQIIKKHAEPIVLKKV